MSLVQHYFGDKANLLKTTLEIQSETMNAYIAERLAGLGADPDPLDVVRTVARAFLPLDEVSRRSMLVYHGFAAAALTDQDLRRGDMFANGRNLIDFFAAQLAAIRTSNDGRRSLSRRLTRMRPACCRSCSGSRSRSSSNNRHPADAIAVLDAHLDRLTN